MNVAPALRVDDYLRNDIALRDDLELYCANLVKIQGKDGSVLPFRWREAQRILHAKIERQRESRGLVRAIVLKARRLGVSTYVAARFYQKSTLWLGRNAFILTHEDKATHTLFNMVKFAHSNMVPDFQPPLEKANENELKFAGCNSGYRVGTAKNITGLGRSMTLQLFHGSEVGFWPHAEQHFAGVMKAVSLTEGTEMILESTANGVGGEFYDQWCKAEKGVGDYVPIFLPWFVDPDNMRPLPSDYEPSTEDLDYQALYKLSDEQLCWAHFENINLGGQPGTLCPMFRQENPSTAAEAFQATGADSLILPQAVVRARNWTAPDQSMLPRVLGVDVARGGGDMTRIVDRQGRKAGRINEVMNVDDLQKVAFAVMRLLRDHPDIRKAFIDITGLGAGVFDICRANNFGTRVSGVNFGSAAHDDAKFKNRRAEMWARMKDWFMDAGNADIPDDDEWHRHIAGPGYKYDFNTRLQLEPKESIKKRLGFSPDAGDALALTFAEILPIDEKDERPAWLRKHLADDDEGFGDFMTS